MSPLLPLPVTAADREACPATDVLRRVGLDVLAIDLELLYPSKLLLQDVRKSQWTNVGLICGGMLLSLLLDHRLR